METCKTNYVFKAAPRTQVYEQDKHDWLNLPFSIGVIGPKGAGKSTIVYNLVMGMYRGRFNQIHLFSGTGGIDDTLGKLRIRPDHMHPGYSEELLQNIIDTQKENIDEASEKKFAELVHENEKDILAMKSEKLQGKRIKDLKEESLDYAKRNAERILIILDDLVSDAILKRSQVLTKLFLNHRHYCVSIILTSQQYRMIPRSRRFNLSALIICQLANEEEWKTLEEELPIDKKIFHSLRKHIYSEPYKFLSVHFGKACNINVDGEPKRLTCTPFCCAARVQAICTKNDGKVSGASSSE